MPRDKLRVWPYSANCAGHSRHAARRPYSTSETSRRGTCLTDVNVICDDEGLLWRTKNIKEVLSDALSNGWARNNFCDALEINLSINRAIFSYNGVTEIREKYVG